MATPDILGANPRVVLGTQNADGSVTPLLLTATTQFFSLPYIAPNLYASITYQFTTGTNANVTADLVGSAVDGPTTAFGVITYGTITSTTGSTAVVAGVPLYRTMNVFDFPRYLRARVSSSTPSVMNVVAWLSSCG